MFFCVDNIRLLPYNDAHRTEQRKLKDIQSPLGSYKIE